MAEQLPVTQRKTESVLVRAHAPCPEQPQGTSQQLGRSPPGRGRSCLVSILGLSMPWGQAALNHEHRSKDSQYLGWCQLLSQLSQHCLVRTF